jgi:phospholipid/cholesterol/gamma-HCH transport system permease protein
MAEVHSDAQGIYFIGALTLEHLPELETETRRLLHAHIPPVLWVDLERVARLDTAGAVFLHQLPALAEAAGKEVRLIGLPHDLRPFFDFISPPSYPPQRQRRILAEPLERLGESAYKAVEPLGDFLFLMSDLTWETFKALIRRGGIRRGTFVEEGLALGSRSLPIIALILFIIGAISAIQSASQLRRFGADILVADLLAIGIFKELGPLMTAIIVAGRNGSAIAAEIATMKLNEELDGLQTMGLDPLRFVAVPKMWAMLLCLPLLAIMANSIAIMGGILISITSLEVTPITFINRAFDALELKDLWTGLIKSISFAWAITIIAVYHGFHSQGGPAGVGRTTTAAVVSSLFGIIALDGFWNLVFFLK